MLVDDEDFPLLNRFVWTKTKGSREAKTFYARTSIRSKKLLAHHLVFGRMNPTLMIDHRNHNGLDNQKDNLRTATKQQNAWNTEKMKTKHQSKYKGVHFRRNKQGEKRWFVVLRKNYKTFSFGTQDSELEAVRVYNKEAMRMFGEYACLNKIDQYDNIQERQC